MQFCATQKGWVRNYILVLLLFTLLGNGAPGFAASKKRVRRKKTQSRSYHVPWLIGAELGINFGFSRNEPKGEGSTRQGLILGVFWERAFLSERLFIQPGVRYLQKGVNTILPVLGFGVGGTIAMDAVEVPILFKYKFGTARFNPYVFVGPTFALALIREIRLLNLVTQTLIDRFNEFDVGLAIGIGTEFVFAKNFRGFVNLRYSLGLVDLQKDGDQYYSRGIELTAGVITVL
ncbi:MAG: PorT family protein [Bdellovibrionales bacterium]|nr:PorT family protein [Bdellovibrionales bacterium]